MHDHEHQGGSDNDHDHKEESSYGWLWIIGIIILVAITLFFLQDNVPQDAVEADDNNAVVEEADVEVVDELAIMPLGIYAVSAPTSATPESFVGVNWSISSDQADAKVDYTSIQWGRESFESTPFKSDTKPEDIYENGTEDYPTPQSIPAKFEANLKTPLNGIIYFRAVAKVGDVYYWSDEHKIAVRE